MSLLYLHYSRGLDLYDYFTKNLDRLDIQMLRLTCKSFHSLNLPLAHRDSPKVANYRATAIKLAYFNIFFYYGNTPIVDAKNIARIASDEKTFYRQKNFILTYHSHYVKTLILGCVKRNNFQLLEWAVNQRSFDIPDKLYEKTVASNRNPEMLEYLLHKIGNHPVVNPLDTSKLMSTAITDSNLAMVEYLYKKFPNCVDSGHFIKATIMEELDILKYLVQNTQVDLSSKILEHAIKNANFDFIEYAFSIGSPLLFNSHFGESAFSYLIESTLDQRLKLVEAMKKSGVYPIPLLERFSAEKFNDKVHKLGTFQQVWNYEAVKTSVGGYKRNDLPHLDYQNVIAIVNGMDDS